MYFGISSIKKGGLKEGLKGKEGPKVWEKGYDFSPNLGPKVGPFFAYLFLLDLKGDLEGRGPKERGPRVKVDSG